MHEKKTIKQGYQTRSIKDSKKKTNNTTRQRFLGRLPSAIVKLLTSVHFNSNVPRLRPAVTVAEDKPGKDSEVRADLGECSYRVRVLYL